MDKKFSPVRKCEHCSNTAPMEIVVFYNDTDSYYDDETGMRWEAGTIYSLLKCPACKNAILRRYFWHSESEPEGSDEETLFPITPGTPSGLPLVIANAYEAARRVRSVDANAYGVLIGRLLELVCADRKATGKDLAARLKDLADKGEIPERLVKVANGLRKLRNVGAHADVGELTQGDLPLLDDLSNAILEYVYSAPTLVERAEERLVKLKGSNPSPTEEGPP